ncbi:major facilitator superfamily MFS_1 [Solidesulfovibrio fructosivorans JJ]]|uniref:Major facilitator superfamily MFS_1 n=1 Tax=Solidesulfovibrio fructosivorans JJ] TaxID=596151 RepID=E1K2M8_SOLFR|nr:sugar transporter [Solidesulfovibrio fructosivorans]EFL49129.1 major facilitator superfamily MFS_1 [Solidesulfovibrio fructosivorans JJ]]
MAVDEPQRRDWIPVILLAFATFVFNTTEFAPISLLGDIAQSLNVTTAKAGQLVTIYAWMVAILSLPLMLACANMERRGLLRNVFLVFIASHVVSGLAPNYYVLLLSRIGVACAHSIFWSIVIPMGIRVAPKNYESRALGILSMGSAVALVLGLPLGRVIGLQLGWRMTFVCIGGMALLAMLALMRRLPVMPSQHAGDLKSLPRLFKRPALVGLYILTLVLITGHFTGYTYIEPFVTRVARGSEDFATLVLLVFGLAGIAGCYFFIRCNPKHPAATFAVPVWLTTVCLLLMRPVMGSLPTLLVVYAVWGMAMSAVNLVLQYNVVRVAPDATDVAMSIYSGIYNIGIGSGALVGGLVTIHMGLEDVDNVAGAIAVAASLWCLYYLRRRG